MLIGLWGERLMDRLEGRESHPIPEQWASSAIRLTHPMPAACPSPLLHLSLNLLTLHTHILLLQKDYHTDYY